MSDIATDGSNISDLRTPDASASLSKTHCVMAKELTLKDHAVGNPTTEMNFLVFDLYCPKLRDSSDVYKCVNWWMAALLNIEKQVGPASNKTRITNMHMQQVHCSIDRFRQVILVPKFHQIVEGSGSTSTYRRVRILNAVPAIPQNDR
jgi:hypothetical protein